MKWLLTLAFLIPSIALFAEEKPWKMHIIDNTSRGADGVRLADVNGDGHLDITTGWEEGGLVRVYLNPGPKKAHEKWPHVTVGKVRSPEDAVFVDLDQDGAVDVVSCCEGRTRSVFVHWAPTKKGDYLNADAWKTEAFPRLEGKSLWMYCLPMQVDGKRGTDLILGAKGGKAELGWLEAPENPRQLKDWKWHPIAPVGWVMSLRANDLDGDGDQDVIVSDRKGPRRAVRWLENPGVGDQQAKPWKDHVMGAKGEEVMFLDLADLNGDGKLDVLVPTFARKLFLLQSKGSKTPSWKSIQLPYPEVAGTGKGVRVGDLNNDGKVDFAMTGRCGIGKHGVSWFSRKGDAWQIHVLSGPSVKQTYKPDRIELVDLDGDGDLDVITSEERSLFGVIWYENPSSR